MSQSVDTFKKAGGTIYALPELEKARWAKVLTDAGVAKKAAARAESHGYPGTEILKAYVKALEKEGYVFPYPPKL
jgi:hypothetical protein